jgi:hypothetical protein
MPGFLALQELPGKAVICCERFLRLRAQRGKAIQKNNVNSIDCHA